MSELLPCPFCGGSVTLERTLSGRSFGVVCRNTLNRGGTCAIEQVPSVTEEAAIERWNMRAETTRLRQQLEIAVRALEKVVAANPTVVMDKPDAFKYIASVDASRKALAQIRELEK